jgi:hypothetical protein
VHVISLETAYAWAPYVILADAGLRVVSHTIESMPVSVLAGFTSSHACLLTWRADASICCVMAD